MRPNWNPRRSGLSSSYKPSRLDNSAIQLLPVRGLPEIVPGDDLASLLCAAFRFRDSDIVVLAQKVVSKAEDRRVSLSSVLPSAEAQRLAAEIQKDARLVQLILDESRRIVRERPGLLIVEDRRGWVCANAGIDRSNVPQGRDGPDVLLLPGDPDRSAAAIRGAIQNRARVTVGVIINDSHGRAWREGTVGVAIGAAGVSVLSDRRGDIDRHGYALEHTLVATADELAAAASMVMGQGDEGVPAVVIRGLSLLGDGRAVDLQRPAELDLFR